MALSIVRGSLLQKQHPGVQTMQQALSPGDDLIRQRDVGAHHDGRVEWRLSEPPLILPCCIYLLLLCDRLRYPRTHPRLHPIVDKSLNTSWNVPAGISVREEFNNFDN